MSLCILDLASGDRKNLGVTTAWSHQQGAMLQWIAGPNGQEVAYNAVEDGKLGCVVVSPDGNGRRFLPYPSECFRPDGAEMLSINFVRLASLGSEYGYGLSAANFKPDMGPADGLWRVDAASGEADLLFSLSDVQKVEPHEGFANGAHEINHAIYSPNGKRFVFMHRWTGPRGRYSRLFLANGDGTGLSVVLDEGMVSHYTWRDDSVLIIYARTKAGGDGYYHLDVDAKSMTPVPDATLKGMGDGHPSYSPDRNWIVTDTYPDKARFRTLALYQPGSDRYQQVGRFLSPLQFDGAVRCDLHPRWSPDGKQVSIDSTHEGLRESYLVTVGGLQ